MTRRRAIFLCGQMITDPASAVVPLALDGLTVIGRGLGRSATSECASFFTPVVQTGQNSLDSHPVKVRSAGKGQLLDVVPGRKAESPTAWLKARGEAWFSQVRRCPRSLRPLPQGVRGHGAPRDTGGRSLNRDVKGANAKLSDGLVACVSQSVFIHLVAAVVAAVRLTSCGSAGLWLDQNSMIS